MTKGATVGPAIDALEPTQEDRPMRTVVIDENLCTGHGRCYSLAPSVFEPDERGQGLVTVSELDAELEEAAQVAVANCPERAIRIVET
jgi:ferredoxin